MMGSVKDENKLFNVTNFNVFDPFENVLKEERFILKWFNIFKNIILLILLVFFMFILLLFYVCKVFIKDCICLNILKYYYY